MRGMANGRILRPAGQLPGRRLLRLAAIPCTAACGRPAGVALQGAVGSACQARLMRRLSALRIRGLSLGGILRYARSAILAAK